LAGSCGIDYIGSGSTRRHGQNNYALAAADRSVLGGEFQYSDVANNKLSSNVVGSV
jgi:hypothetical protein